MIQLIKRYLVPVIIWVGVLCTLYSFYEAAKEQHKVNLLRKENIYKQGVEEGLQKCQYPPLNQSTIKQEK